MLAIGVRKAAILGKRSIYARALTLLRSRGDTLWFPGPGVIGGINPGNNINSTGFSGAKVGDFVGLARDAVGQFGSELVVGGDFPNNGADWTAGSGWSIVNGVATFTPGVLGTISQPMSVENGRHYLLALTFTRTAGTLSVRLGSTTAASISTTIAGGTLRRIIPATGTENILQVVGNSTFAGTVSGVSIKLISGLQLAQATTPDKPALQQVGSAYRWVFDGTDTLSTTAPVGVGYESCTVIDATPTGQVTLTGQNLVGTYTLGPNLTTHGRIISRGSLTPSELVLYQALANKLAGL